MKYRPVAPDDLEKLVVDLRRLQGETVLPWQFDHQTNEFFVEANGKAYPVTFGNGDTETLLVLALVNNLDLLLAAVAGKFVLINGEWSCRPTKNDLPGSNPPPTETSSPPSDAPASAPPGCEVVSVSPSRKRSSAVVKKSARKRPAKSAKK